MQQASNNQPGGAPVARNLTAQYGVASTEEQQRMQQAAQGAGMPSPSMLSPSVAHRARRQHTGPHTNEVPASDGWQTFQEQAAHAATVAAQQQQRGVQQLPGGGMYLPNVEPLMQPHTGALSHVSDGSLGSSITHGFAQVSSVVRHTALPCTLATLNLGAESSDEAPTRPGVSTPLRKTAGWNATNR